MSKNRYYKFHIIDDKLHCITRSIFMTTTDGKKIDKTYGKEHVYFPSEVDVGLPERVKNFFGFRMDNSECIAIDDVPSVKWLRKRLREKSVFEDISVRIRKNIVTISYTPPLPTPDTVPKLECMSKHSDGAHCGLGDWYPEVEQGIQKALLKSKGGCIPNWTTGWYSSKKEIASARISKFGNILHIEVSISDDFDTNGTAFYDIPMTKDLEKIREAIYKVWGMAEGDQKDNRMYRAYSIGHRKGNKRKDWIYTYLVNSHGLDAPTGDNYHNWGWQEEKMTIPRKVKYYLKVRMEEGAKKVCCGHWVAEQWDD